MSRQNQAHARTAPIFQPNLSSAPSNPIPSSSPAFGTPVHPVKSPTTTHHASNSTVLPVLLPPPTLRPVAFRVFTKKHNLTLTSSALQALASFIGRHCGSGWREEGLAEKVLEEAARMWKKNGGGVIVAGEGDDLAHILKNIEGCMVGGRVVQSRNLSRQSSFALDSDAGTVLPNDVRGRPGLLGREDSQTSLGISSLDVDDDDEREEGLDPRRWLTMIGGFEQPRLVYNVAKKHFEKSTLPRSLFSPAAHTTHLFRNRYNLVHQRLLRNEAFQTPTFGMKKRTLQRADSNIPISQQSYKLTPIANLLGRSGSSHLLLAMLIMSPTGKLALTDLTGSISLDLQHAKDVPEDGAWFTPGMIVLVDGIYEEDYSSNGGGLGETGGVGGTIGGKFIAFSIGGPPCERREASLGIKGSATDSSLPAGGGFGWVDFLGVGSERAMGSRMRRMEQRILAKAANEDTEEGRARIVIIGEVNLDRPKILEALRKVLGTYAVESEASTPMAFVFLGNFVRHAVMAGGGSGGSIEYKEYFDSLAAVLSDYPSLLQNSSFIFVPGDNDPWASAFSAGAATAIPRKGVPELFTSRIKRAFAVAQAEAERATGRKPTGEAIWTTNPSRLSLFGPIHELVLFRDDVLGRLRRNAVRFNQSKPDTTEAVEEDIVMSGANNEPETADGEMPDRNGPVMEVDAEVQEAESQQPNTGADGEAGMLSNDVRTARKLVKTILDQGYLSPFPLSTRPVLWDYANALQLYPLPTAMVLADVDAPAFTVTYEGCHVMNPGQFVPAGRRSVARWVEYDSNIRKGKVRESVF